MSKKLIIFEIVCVLAIIGMIGYTYSFFNVTVSNSSVISGEAASANLTLTVTKVSPSDTKGLVPQLDDYITSAVIGRKGSCVDDNNNNVCHVYKITLKNSGAAVYVNGTVTLSANNNPNLKWAQISGPTSPTLTSNIHSNKYMQLTSNELYNSGEEKNYYIVLWISEIGGMQTDKGKFTGIVRFGNVDNIQSAAKDTLTRLGLVESVGIPDFSKTSCLSECGESTVGIFKAADDMGTSYYFRGDVENNYVYFAGFYWRIIRINGDGSIRMIYDGISTHDNGESSTDRIIGSSVFNENNDDNAYVGFMYGTAGASAYAETHANTNESKIKTALDTWYTNNIKDTTNEQYIADAIYCNDREVSTADSNYTGDGSSTTKTAYKAYERLYTSKTPILQCNQVNDRFTKSTTVSGVTGNGKLTNAIGLITMDEVAYAGGTWLYNNSNFYLYTGSWYWTMSPNCFDGSYALELYVYSDTFFCSNCGVDYEYNVRPVISLSSSALSSGKGTKTEPFTIGT